MKRILIINLPNARKLTRRYMCSYITPTYLFPPLELLSCASVVRQIPGVEVHFMDCIATRTSESEVCAQLAILRPDMLVALIGFECFGDDMSVLSALKRSWPQMKVMVFGHYPSTFPEEISAHEAVDVVVTGEPENALYDLVSRWSNTEDKESDPSGIVSGHRISQLDGLPPPAHDLIDPSLYSEALMPRPFSMIQSARGCPYGCNFCVRSYGRQLSLLSAEQVVEQIEMLIDLHHIQSLRFIDDTFTINKKRVIDICKLLVEKKIGIRWTCLSRTDNIEAEMLSYMKTAGCERVYFGIESGSQRMLDLYQKGLNVSQAKSSIRLVRQAGIQTTGFFMLGLPDETEEDFALTLRFALDSDLTLASVGGITLYPGTPLFDRYRQHLSFSLFPYVNRFNDTGIEERYLRWERKFYRSFYLRPAKLAELAIIAGRNPALIWREFAGVNLFGGVNFGITPGIKRQHQNLHTQIVSLPET